MKFVFPSSLQSASSPGDWQEAAREPGMAEWQKHCKKINSDLKKRGLDIFISSVLLLFLLPAFLLLAVLIKLSSPGPVFFAQQRYGRGHRLIRVLKFRTMSVMEAEGSFVQASRNDHRVTAVGRWLRRSSMDELPQLLNVLGGSMSLVGPRPHAVAMDDFYGPMLPGYGIRHQVKPGMSGLAQVSGFRGATEKLEDMKARLHHDLEYIRDWSIRRDLIILLRTPVVLFGDDVF